MSTGVCQQSRIFETAWFDLGCGDLPSEGIDERSSSRLKGQLMRGKCPRIGVEHGVMASRAFLIG